MNKAELMSIAKYEKNEMKHPYIGSEHFMLAVLTTKDKDFRDLLRKYNLTYKNYKEEVINVIGLGNKDFSTNLFTPAVKRMMEGIITDCSKYETYFLNGLLILEEGIGFRVLLQLLNRLGHKHKDLLHDLQNMMDENYDEIKEETEEMFGEDERNRDKEEICVEMGLTNPYIHGRDNELKLIEKTLIQLKKPNVILVGEAGVGKTALMEKLAYNIKQGKCSSLLNGYKVYEMSTNNLIAGTQYRGQFEERIRKLVSKYKNKKAILFIDEFHTSTELGSGAEGCESLGNILKPYLARGELKVVGATTKSEFKYIEKDSAYNRRFRKVDIEEPTLKQMETIMKNCLTPYTKHYGVKVTKEQAVDIVKKSKDIEACNPDKSFTVLELAMSNAKFENREFITDEDIDYGIKYY